MSDEKSPRALRVVTTPEDVEKLTARGWRLVERWTERRHEVIFRQRENYQRTEETVEVERAAFLLESPSDVVASIVDELEGLKRERDEAFSAKWRLEDAARRALAELEKLRQEIAELKAELATARNQDDLTRAHARDIEADLARARIHFGSAAWATEPSGVRRFWHPPGTLLARSATHTHRIVELPNGPAWTLLLVGKKERSWGFHTLVGWVHWRRYLSGAVDLCGEGR